MLKETIAWISSRYSFWSVCTRERLWRIDLTSAGVVLWYVLIKSQASEILFTLNWIFHCKYLFYTLSYYLLWFCKLQKSLKSVVSELVSEKRFLLTCIELIVYVWSISVAMYHQWSYLICPFVSLTGSTHLYVNILAWSNVDWLNFDLSRLARLLLWLPPPPQHTLTQHWCSY